LILVFKIRIKLIFLERLSPLIIINDNYTNTLDKDLTIIDDMNFDTNKVNKQDATDLSMMKTSLFISLKLFRGCLLIAKKSEVL
jgi:hypothetical protein